MAERIKGTTKKAARKKKDNGDGAPGIGHNITAIKKAAAPLFKRLDALFDEMESQMGEFRVDIKNLYEEGANTIGVKRQVLRKVYGQYRRAKKDEAAENEMEASEHDDYVALRDAMGMDTPFGAFAARKAEETASKAAD